ncbi:ATPase domain-containing protein [Salinibaculum rarum]|uniref:ATPase domain-containing protein n=1 Tax=Salinibaculum rarum TaxID=3058903 RepID=UPI00265E7888|nr:ATPase domain-containing protein [Salinibaculum sp. KK48]
MTELSRVSTGIDGLDEILRGGLVAGRSYLLRGEPGAGKSILGLHFLTAGVDAGETSLYINLEEPTAQVRDNAESLNFDVSGIEFLDLSPSSEFFAEDQSYSVFESSEVEQTPMAKRITERVTELQPDRVFLDPVTQFRYLTSDEYQFRKQIISFLRYLKENDATVLFTSQWSETTPDDDLQFLADGVIELSQSEHGRTLEVPKLRGSDKQGGTHSLTISADGIDVYPVLVPGDHTATFESDVLKSGVANLDSLLDGGLEQGTVTVVSGPTGVGKTTTGSLFMTQAAAQGERSVIYMFEENESTFRHRSEAIGIPVSEMVEEGTLAIEEIEPLEFSPEKFASMVRKEVEQRDTSVVMLDGIKGYTLSIQGDEKELIRKLHALGRYLKNMGVTVIFLDEVASVSGEFRPTESGISYLADNILFLRYAEMGSEIGKVVGVLKKRVGTYERTLRPFNIGADGITVGDPLSNVDDLLSGSPSLDPGREE